MEHVSENEISDNERNESVEQTNGTKSPEEDSEVITQDPSECEHEEKGKSEDESKSEEENTTSKNGIDEEKEKETSRNIFGLFDAVWSVRSMQED